MTNNFCPNGIYFEKSKQTKCLFNNPSCDYKDFKDCHFYQERIEKPVANTKGNAYLVNKTGSA